MDSPMLPSLFFLAALLLATNSEATEFLVGGSATAWKTPSPASQTLNQWAEATRFQVGDSLVWKLDGKTKDSVLQVSRTDYLTCNTSNPIAHHSEGTVIVKLDHSGPYYFISGANGACESGQKVAVVVMAERKIKSTGTRRFSPAPSPMEFEDGPAVAPTSDGGRKTAGLLVVGGTIVFGMMGLVL